MKTEFLYEPRTKFKYDYKGDIVECQTITLLAPSAKHINETAYLKQSFFRAIPKDQSADTSAVSNDKMDFTGEDIMGIISMSHDVDLAKVLLTAKELFSKGVALMDGETKMTKVTLDKMPMDELEEMLGDYLVNFILASALAKMKNSSGK